MHGSFKDLSGKKFGNLQVLSFNEMRKDGARFNVRCYCGKIFIERGATLKNGKRKSCGCASYTQGNLSRSTHYALWNTMMDRCRNENNKDFPRYGGRGIQVCDEWKSFMNFFKDMGKRPSGKQLDRIDCDKNYCKENCRWITPKENCNNRRDNLKITFMERTQTLSQWADEVKISYNNLFQRIYKFGWSIEQALTLKKGSRI